MRVISSASLILTVRSSSSSPPPISSLRLARPRFHLAHPRGSIALPADPRPALAQHSPSTRPGVACLMTCAPFFLVAKLGSRDVASHRARSLIFTTLGRSFVTPRIFSLAALHERWHVHVTRMSPVKGLTGKEPSGGAVPRASPPAAPVSASCLRQFFTHDCPGLETHGLRDSDLPLFGVRVSARLHRLGPKAAADTILGREAIPSRGLFGLGATAAVP